MLYSLIVSFVIKGYVWLKTPEFTGICGGEIAAGKGAGFLDSNRIFGIRTNCPKLSRMGQLWDTSPQILAIMDKSTRKSHAIKLLICLLCPVVTYCNL
jgi:hypothetical protein